MESCYWCTTCAEMYDNDSGHADHDIKHIGGPDPTQTLSALDEMIEIGLSALKHREQEAANAKEVKDDIDDIRAECLKNAQDRTKRICKDLLVQMEYRTGELMKEVDQTVGDMELRCQSVITTSRVKFETIKGFIKEAALTLPDDTGKLDARQLGKLYAFYKTMAKMEKQPRARIKHVEFNIKYPDSYERKKECKALAASVSGKVENPQRKSFLHDPLPEEEPRTEDIITPLKKPTRKISRDLLRN